jgi:betaine-homocysteine S-methyltransferase
VASESGALLAGNVCNTNVYTGEQSRETVRGMFEEQVAWAVEAGADFVIAETLSWLGEALVATEVINATGLPAVVTLAAHQDPHMREGVSPAEACKRLEAAGADVVGLNCSRGPETMLPLLEEVRRAVSVHVAALPVPYRTTEEEPSFQSLEDPRWTEFPAGRPFPTALEPFTCNRYEIAEFARAAYELGARYLGVCCGAAPHHIRSMAEALGRTPPASRYSADMSKHAYLGSDPSLRAENQDYAERL